MYDIDIKIDRIKKPWLVVIILMLTVTLSSNGQRFIGTAVLGFNAAQIDGDDLIGYNKLGWTGGARIAYGISEKSKLIMELLYSQRGSTPDIAFGNPEFNTIDLKYFEIPFLIEYNDWYMADEDYFKVGVEAGLSYANLFSVTTSNQLIDNGLEGFKKHDFSYTIGLRYSINKNWAGLFRFSRTVGRIFRNEDADLEGLSSHWLSFRLHYTF